MRTLSDEDVEAVATEVVRQLRGVPSEPRMPMADMATYRKLYLAAERGGKAERNALYRYQDSHDILPMMKRKTEDGL